MVYRISLFLMIFFTAISMFAQSGYQFTKGLIAGVPSRYGREALYMDQLAYQLYNHTLKQPVAGETFATDDKGQALKWQPVTADSLNRLRGRSGFGARGGPAGPGVTQGSARNSISVGGYYIYLSYTSDKEQAALLNIKGNSAVYINGEPHMGDAYNLGYLYIPMQLKKGLNEFYVRGANVVANLFFPPKPVLLNIEDPTLPSIIIGKQNTSLQGAIVVVNTSSKELKGLQIKSSMQGKDVVSNLPAVPAMSCRKVPFTFNGTGITTKGKWDCMITLLQKDKLLDETKMTIEATAPAEQYSSTFTSKIDGSLQYYAVTPQSSSNTANAALFLSVHGAGVEAIGQARAYKPKDWGTLAAATNRRPRGFNWEDWGRLDALEVLEIARTIFKPDPQRIYLTGHSMGGHGTWFLGATYPDKWAAIGACAGYPTLKGYGSADGLIPDSSTNPLEQMLLRSGNQSDVPKLVTNYKPLGVYVLHGDADRTVPVTYARQMRELLGRFHTDISYYEYPDGGHWFGDQSVDWNPLFDFFKWHTLAPDSAVDKIDFTTASPGISASYRWASIQQQLHPLQYSKIQLNRNRAAGTITGTTGNIRLLKLALADFGSGTPVKITLDGGDAVTYTTGTASDSLYLLKDGDKWTITTKPGLFQKGPHRYGTFKDAFNNNMVFVYGTTGTKEENNWSFQKAKYDAETWYYRGNGAVDIISDTEFSVAKYKDRGVILFGNKNTNAAWNVLLVDCPIQVERNKVTAGSKVWAGDDLSAYFVWPLKNSSIASVAVISGSGLKGMKAANANQYFAGASGFPDFMIYGFDMLNTGVAGVKMAGFFDNDWKLSETDYVQTN